MCGQRFLWGIPASHWKAQSVLNELSINPESIFYLIIVASLKNAGIYSSTKTPNMTLYCKYPIL